MYSCISSKAKFYFKKKLESILCVCVLTQCCVMRPEVYHDPQSVSHSLIYATVLMCHLTLLLFKDHL